MAIVILTLAERGLRRLPVRDIDHRDRDSDDLVAFIPHRLVGQEIVPVALSRTRGPSGFDPGDHLSLKRAADETLELME
jgi:hypothetical protein